MKKRDPMQVLEAWKKGEKRLPKKVFKQLLPLTDTLKEVLDQGQAFTLGCGMKIRAKKSKKFTKAVKSKSKGFTLDDSFPTYTSDLDKRRR